MKKFLIIPVILSLLTSCGPDNDYAEGDVIGTPCNWAVPDLFYHIPVDTTGNGEPDIFIVDSPSFNLSAKSVRSTEAGSKLRIEALRQVNKDQWRFNRVIDQ